MGSSRVRVQKDNRVQELKQLLNIRTDERVKLSTAIRFRLAPENASEETGGESEMRSTSTSPPGTASTRVHRSLAAGGSLSANAYAVANEAGGALSVAASASGCRISPVTRRATFLRALQFGARLMHTAKRSSASVSGDAPPGIVVRSPSAGASRASIPNQKHSTLSVSFGGGDALRRQLRKISTPIPSVSEPKESSPSSSRAAAANNKPESTTQKIKNFISMRQFSSPLSARKHMHHQQSFEQNDEHTPGKCGSAQNIPHAGSATLSSQAAGARTDSSPVVSSTSNVPATRNTSVVTSQALVHNKPALVPQLSVPQHASLASCAGGSFTSPLVRKNSSASARPGLAVDTSCQQLALASPLPVADSNESNELTSGFYSGSGFSAAATQPSISSLLARRALPSGASASASPHTDADAGRSTSTQIELKTAPAAATSPRRERTPASSRDLLSLDQIRADSTFSETLI